MKVSSSEYQLLNSCKHHVSAYRKDFSVPKLQFSLSFAQESSQLNGNFTSAGMSRVVEGKEYAVVYIIFTFIAAFMDRTIGCEDFPVITKVHKMYSDIVNQLLSKKLVGEVHRTKEVVTRENILGLVMLTKNLFEELEEFSLLKLGFNTLDHVVEDVSLINCIIFIYMSPFNTFNYVIEKIVRMTSMRRGSKLKEDRKAMNASGSIKERRNSTGERTRKVKLVKDGTVINLVKNATSTLASFAHIRKNGETCYLFHGR